MKARLNQKVLNDFITLPETLAVSGLIRNEKIMEAIIKPRTNLGKRSHMIEADTFFPFLFDLSRYVQKTEIAKAASPKRTFCENLTIVAYLRPVSPAMVPAATTAPVVSMVPPSQAPVTTSDNPIQRAITGIKIIIGIAIIRTSEIMNDNFFLSPLIAPAVAIAADTPQIETALESIVAYSSSTLSLRETQNVKYHTVTTTITACKRPNVPAVIISLNRIVAPSRTSPILT